MLLTVKSAISLPKHAHRPSFGLNLFLNQIVEANGPLNNRMISLIENFEFRIQHLPCPLFFYLLLQWWLVVLYLILLVVLTNVKIKVHQSPHPLSCPPIGPLILDMWMEIRWQFRMALAMRLLAIHCVIRNLFCWSCEAILTTGWTRRRISLISRPWRQFA